MRIYADAETIPGQGAAVREALEVEATAEKAEVKAPSNYKDPDKIAEFVLNKRAEIDAAMEEKWRKTALDGAYGQIAVFSIAIDEAPPVAFYQEDWANGERQILRDLFAALVAAYDPATMRRPVFIGHNLIEFDLRFLFQRAIILGIKPPPLIPFQAKPWDDAVFDTMTQWAGVKNRVSLDKLCKALGIPGKGSELGGEEIDGSKVWDFVKAGRIADVATYCKGDVERVRQAHKRMTFWQGN